MSAGPERLRERSGQAGMRSPEQARVNDATVNEALCT